MLTSVDLKIQGTLATATHGLQYLGPTLRGAFGHVLKDAATRGGAAATAYELLFEGKAPTGRRIMRNYPSIPQPFVFEVAPPGDWWGSRTDLQFSMRLFGEACEHIDRICAAFKEVGIRGLGPRRTQFNLTACETASPSWHKDKAIPSRIRWSFETPLSMRIKGRDVVRPTGLNLLLAGRRRWFIMNEFYGSHADELDQGERVSGEDFHVESASLRPWAIERFSGRQQRSVPLRGVGGEMIINGPWAATGGWLHEIEHTHLGKHCSFGLGRVKWEAA